MPLKEFEVRYTQRRRRPFKLSNGGGLHLLVQLNRSKLWRLKYRFDGKEKLLSFGKYPGISLAAAREKHCPAKALLAAGICERGADCRAPSFDRPADPGPLLALSPNH